MKKIDDLVIVDELHKAIRCHTPAEREALKAEIKSDASIHDPVLWARLYGGVEAVVDGHTRLAIRDELLQEEDLFIDEPRTAEVESLRDCSVEEAVEWIRRHQISRRNIHALDELYAIGKSLRETGKTSAQIAVENGITPSRARHAAAMADKIDAAETLVPNSREAILSSDVSPSAIRDSEPSELLEMAGVLPRKNRNNGPLSVFSAITKAIATLKSSRAAISRAINTIQSQDGDSLFSEDCISRNQSISDAIDELESSVESWIASKVI